MRRVLWILFCLTGLIVSGCGPARTLEPEQMISALPERFSVRQSIPADGDRDVPWWETLEDIRLNALIDLVLENNLDLLRSDARVAEIQALAAAAGVGRYPSLSLGAEVATSRVQSRKTTIYSLSLPAAFELDLWGRLARLEKAARLELLATQYNHQALAQSLAAQAAGLYFQIRSLEKKRVFTEQSVDNYRRSLELVEGRYRRGLASLLEVRQADRLYARARAAVPALRQEEQAVRRNLNVLTGRFIPEADSAGPAPVSFSPPPGVPAGLPSELLLRRPDVASARAGVDALWARTRAARAARFPALRLTGAAGYSSPDLDQLVRQPSRFWNAALGITQPLVNAGGLKAQEDAAARRYEQAVYAYGQAVLTAFSEVEQALYAREQLTRRWELLQELNQVAVGTLETAQGRYERGLVDYLSVLEAQQSCFTARIDLVEVEAALYQNFVTINRVLGGGWGKDDADGTKHPTDEAS